MSLPVKQLGGMLEVPAPPVTVQQAETLAMLLFGLNGRARPLAGERDRNFHFVAEGGEVFVLKVAHPLEDPAVLDLQDKALRHVEAVDPSLPIPRVRPLRDGVSSLWGSPGASARTIRLLTYLSGEPLSSSTAIKGQRQAIGRCLARLDLALARFRHPAEGHDLLWDLQRAVRVRPLLEHVPLERRALPLRFIDGFEQQVLPHLPSLRTQLIHNDFNPHNILVGADDRAAVVGIIDFGDMVHAPLVQDLATAAAYHVGGESGFEGACEVVAAYNEVCRLTEEEVALLPAMIGMRLTLNIAISSWRATGHPDNADYILRNQTRAWDGLRVLAGLSAGQAKAEFRRACGRE